MKTKYYLYVGYYEVYIVTFKMESPRALLSTHRTAQAALRKAEHECPSATILCDEDAISEILPEYLLEELQPVASINNEKIYQL